MAICCLSLLHRLDKINVEKAVNYIVSCKNHDDGFGCTSGGESHAGRGMSFTPILSVWNFSFGLVLHKLVVCYPYTSRSEFIIQSIVLFVCENSTYPWSCFLFVRSMEISSHSCIASLQLRFSYVILLFSIKNLVDDMLTRMIALKMNAVLNLLILSVNCIAKVTYWDCWNCLMTFFLAMCTIYWQPKTERIIDWKLWIGTDRRCILPSPET